MLYAGSVERRLSTRTFDSTNHEHFHGFTEYLIDADPAVRPAPQAFLVHQDPLWRLTPHFHLQEQFQLVVGGSGTLGVHPLLPGSIHYATRETGYGPIVAGPEGLEYMTLRCVTDPGAWYLPQSRDKQRSTLSKRQKWADAPPAPGGDDEVHLTEALAPDDSGLAAWFLRLPPQAQAKAPEGRNHAGRFHVVLTGSMRAAPVEDELPVRGCIFSSADEPPLEVRAGAEGLFLAILQFPATALHAM